MFDVVLVAVFLAFAAAACAAAVLGAYRQYRRSHSGPEWRRPRRSLYLYSPDCALIRSWLRAHYGEVEVCSWGERTVFRDPDGSGHIHLNCLFRRKGTSHTLSGHFVIGPKNVLESSMVQD
jgi:hypothetical protein